MSERDRLFHPVTGCLAGVFLLLMSPAVIDGGTLRQRPHGEVHDDTAANEQNSITNRDPAARRVEAADPSAAGQNPQRTQDEPGKDPREYVLFGDRLAQGWMTIIAALGLLIGGATIFLINRTVKLQRDATGHALSAAEAGWEAARATAAQSIAYVHAVSAIVPKKREETGSALADMIMRDHCPLYLRLINTGQTVAKDVGISFVVEVGKQPYRASKFSALKNPKRIPVSTIAPQQEPPVRLIPNLKQEIERLRKEEGATDDDILVLRGVILYSDVADNDYSTAFRFLFGIGVEKFMPFDEDEEMLDTSNGLPAFELLRSAKDKKK